MKLVIGKEIKSKRLLKNVYKIKIETMEGDADDYHEIEYWVDTQEEVLEKYSQYKTLRELNQDVWNVLPFWGMWENSIYYNCNSEWYDSLEEFKVIYYDEAGHKFKVKLVEEN